MHQSLIDFRGRVGRLGYVVACAVILLAAIPADLGVTAVLKHLGVDTSDGLSHMAEWERLPANDAVLGVVVTLGVLFIFFVVSLSFDVRRLHDIGVSGQFVWLGLLSQVIPLPDLPDPIPSPRLWAWRCVLMLWAGHRGANRFGPEPMSVRRATTPGASEDV